MRYVLYRCDCCNADIEIIPMSADKNDRHSLTFEYLDKGLYSSVPAYMKINVCDECLDRIAKAMASNNGIMDDAVRRFCVKRLEKQYDNQIGMDDIES